MNRRVAIVVMAVLGIGGLVAGALLWNSYRRQAPASQITEPGLVTVQVKTAAPDFTLTSIDGDQVSLSSLRGKNVVLFFADGLSCLPCLGAMVELARDERLNNGQTVSFAVVQERREDWTKARDYMGWLSNVKVLFDTDRAVFRAYSALELSKDMMRGYHMLHTYLIIDPEGSIRYVVDDADYMGVRNDILVACIKAASSA